MLDSYCFHYRIELHIEQPERPEQLIIHNLCHVSQYNKNDGRLPMADNDTITKFANTIKGSAPV